MSKMLAFLIGSFLTNQRHSKYIQNIWFNSSKRTIF